MDRILPVAGRFDEGIGILQKARDLFPAKYELTYSIASIYSHKGDYDQAERELKTLTSKNQPLK